MAKFKTRARAVDMLGRQQIAGIPTAISELFKNAHDAYADNVVVDYYRSDSLFVLRDDGFGMTKDDFEKRWLTLGTESKIGSEQLSIPMIPTGKTIRPILGEKGIGRLSIAAIGPQVFVMTRPIRDNRPGDLVAAFINWGMFECPGINIDQIEIPLRRFEKGTLPSLKDVREMVEEVKANLKLLRDAIPAELHKRLRTELDSFKIDPIELDTYLATPSLKGGSCGTQFYVSPVDRSLPGLIDEDGDGSSSSALIKGLIGFSNTMTPDHSEPFIRASFRDHKTDVLTDELIGESAFFTPEEFQIADHHISGTFDEYGQFSGKVKIYNLEPIEHQIAWPAAHGKPTDCGPFTVNFSVIQGAQRESELPPEEWARMTAKMNKIGGLYIYRNGIRVLPYGNSDFDFLDIEKNRTKSAAYYYFSFRRLFGVIEIKHDQNPNLIEKAGREGFQENIAYRQFRNILKDFFVQLAADFFREGGAHAADYTEKKIELDRLERARRKREKLVSVKRDQLKKSLDVFFEESGAGKPELEAKAIFKELDDTLNSIPKSFDDADASSLFIESESTARRKASILRESLRVNKPRGVGLSKQLRRDWEAYQSEFERLQNKVLLPLESEIENKIGELAQKARVSLDRRRRFERSLKDLISEAQSRTNTSSTEARKIVSDVHVKVRTLTKESIAELDRAVQETLVNFSKMDLVSLSESTLAKKRIELEDRITKTAESENELLRNVSDQLAAINLEKGEHALNNLDVEESLEEEVLALRERADQDLELTQLGMAIEIINHEFEASVRSIRTNLRTLHAWADVNEELQEVYRNIRANFDHLDGYLNLFTPLHRRLYKKAVTITGGEIEKFLEDLFRERIRRHAIEFKATSRFSKKKITGYPSNFYPAFVNLVDNAIFWLSDRPKPHIIQLDSSDDGFLVSDNGPGIQARDIDSIFEMGFTRKPAGRGLGLFISREALRKTGYELTVSKSQLGGATFRIREVKRKNEDE